MAGRPNPRPSGALESEIVACLAAADEPLTPGQVRAELGDELAYTTVLTTLTRLHAKQAVTRTRRGRAYAYALLGGQTETEAGLTAREMQKLLDAGVDRASVLTHFVRSLDHASEQVLRDLLEQHPSTDLPADNAPSMAARQPPARRR